MSTMAWVLTGWVLTLGIVVGYVAVVIRRGRALSRQVPAEEQRWM
jgi:uncharacterized membrane-anchored protein YhcB (DUF1043 family)